MNGKRIEDWLWSWVVEAGAELLSALLEAVLRS
jgi:hypothetical protein